MHTQKQWFETWFDTNYYHTLYQHRDYKEAQFFINNLMNYLKLPQPSTILDLACGKGRHSLQLAEMGHQVLGVDLSPNSIGLAKELIHKNLNLTFGVQDMRTPLVDQKFDAILNLFTSFGYFDDTHDNLKVLTAIESMLNPGGLFVIDFLNPTIVKNNLVAKETKELDGITFDITRKIESNKIVKSIRINDNGATSEYYEKVQAIDLNDFESLIDQTNLTITDVFGNYQLEAFDEETSNRLILVGSTIAGNKKLQ